MSEISKFAMRIPTPIYEELKELAEKDNRSINNYLTIMIQQHVEENKHKLDRYKKMHIDINLPND